MTDRDLGSRLAWRFRRELAEPVLAAGRRRRSRAIERLGPPPTPPTAPSCAEVDVVVSHRIDNDDRLTMLRVVSSHVGDQLRGTGARVLVADASEGRWSGAVDETWAATGLEVVVSHAAESLPIGLLRLLAESDRPFAAVQFDDMLTAGMTGPILEASCGVLASGVVDVVCPAWPLSVRVDGAARVVRLDAYERDGDHFRFWSGRRRRAITHLTAGGVDFGVFENFTYGFFVNQMVARREDLHRRLAWFVQQVSDRSAHDIELAAAVGRGPQWTHLALPLHDVALLDLDYAHTSAAVRNEHPANRTLLDAVDGGWPIVVDVRSAGATGASR